MAEQLETKEGISGGRINVRSKQSKQKTLDPPMTLHQLGLFCLSASRS
jgi:hypothetical protein